MSRSWESRWNSLKEFIRIEKEGIPEKDSEFKLLTNIEKEMKKYENMIIPD